MKDDEHHFTFAFNWRQLHLMLVCIVGGFWAKHQYGRPGTRCGSGF